MKTVIPLIAFVFLIQCSTLAQPRDFGLKLGAVAAKQTWLYAMNPELPAETRWGVDVGAFAEWQAWSALSILTELHYSQRGMINELNVTTADFPDGTGRIITLDYEIDYLSIPLLLKGRVGNERVEAFLVAGPRLDLKLGARGAAALVYDRFRDVSYGPTIGGGVVFRRSVLGHDLGLDYRYSPAVGSEYSTPLLEVTGKSMEILLTIGFSPVPNTD